MKKSHSFLLLVLMLLAAYFNHPFNATAQEPTDFIYIATGEYPPYVSEQLENYGPLAEIITEVFSEMGYTVRYQFYPWIRGEERVRAGLAFATFPYRSTPERRGNFDFSEPVYTVRAKLFYYFPNHPEGISVGNTDDLQEYRIGGLLGSWYNSYFEEAEIPIENVNSMDLNFQKLYRDRIDLTIEEENSCWSIIRELYPEEVDNFRAINSPIAPEDPNNLCLMVSRSYPNAERILNEFNQVLNNLREDGRRVEILSSHGLAIDE
ncbi:MAG: substrate-binding periplasmic protein [Spirochaetia bacterium]